MEDLIFARLLQEEYDRDAATQITEKENVETHKKSRTQPNSNKSNSSYELSPVDPSLELSDPNPDIRSLFLQFNETYFWGRLSSIEVKWSPRMTLCAGLCVYEGRGGLCSVRLSQPLLKLRPRKDLVETLLHEMIHAYLFITDNDRDHDGHGPNFKSHMTRINKITGADISIYHNFHDEVESYQQHWWRCNGPCQNRRPYYGYVKRSMNREPSPRDIWWEDHRRDCGGKFTKIKEPEDYKKKKEKNAKNKSHDIRSFISNGQPPNQTQNLQKKILPGINNTTKSVMVNGVFFPKGKTSLSPLFSTSDKAAAPLKTHHTVDLTTETSGDQDWADDEDDSWMLSAESIENIPKHSEVDTTSLADKKPKPATRDDPSFTQESKIYPGMSNKLNRETSNKKFQHNFVSVCEPIDNIISESNKLTKFFLGESDTDDDLWEESGVKLNNGIKLLGTDQFKKFKANLTNPPSDVSVSSNLNKNKQSQISVTSESVVEAGSDKINQSTPDSSTDCGLLQSELQDESRFTGQGYRLGSANVGTSYLSQVRKTFAKPSTLTSQPPGSSRAIPRTQPSAVTTLGMTSSRAIPGTQPSVATMLGSKKRTSNEAFGGQTTSTLDNVTVPFAGDSIKLLQPESCVQCPVCGQLVDMSTINSHLDSCLQ